MQSHVVKQYFRNIQWWLIFGLVYHITPEKTAAHSYGQLLYFTDILNYVKLDKIEKRESNNVTILPTHSPYKSKTTVLLHVFHWTSEHTRGILRLLTCMHALQVYELYSRTVCTYINKHTHINLTEKSKSVSTNTYTNYGYTLQ